MNAYVNLYMNNPTKGNTDGTPISLDSTGAAPLSVTLDATANEHKILKCAIRCEEGYKTEGDVIISFSGTTADKWSVAKDNNYADANAAESASFGSSFTITDVIGSTNYIFWIKASSSSDEKPKSDTSVKLLCKAPIIPSD